jgi:hypothetical protein
VPYAGRETVRVAAVHGGEGVMNLMPPPNTKFIPTSKWYAIRMLCRVFWGWRASRLEMGLTRPSVLVAPHPGDMDDRYEVASELTVTLRFVGMA